MTTSIPLAFMGFMMPWMAELLKLSLPDFITSLYMPTIPLGAAKAAHPEN